MLNKIKNPNFYESVHLLRGISALIVLLAHNFVWYCYLPGVNLFVDGETLRSFAQVGVTIFFVISGFVLPLSLIKSYELSDYPRFLAKRLIRVEPTYLASIALALGIVMLTTRIAPNAVPFHLDINQLLAHLLYLIPFTEFDWYSAVYWTLAIEFQFYLLIALLFPLWRRNYAFSIIVAVGFSGLFFLRGLFPEIGLFSKAPLFAVGMLSVSAVKTKKQSQRFFALVVAVIVASLYGALTRFYDLSASAIAVAALIVFWKPPRIKVRYLGTISYSLYVTHYPIIHLVNRGTRHFLGVEASPYLLYAIAFGNLILALLVSHFFYQLIEKPAQKLSKKVRYEKSKMKEVLEQAATSEVSKLHSFGHFEVENSPVDFSQNPKSMILSMQRGKLITALLRDRGRSRRLMIDWFQRKQLARLDAMVEGGKKPRISARTCDIPISITSWMPRKDPLPLVLLSMIEQSLRPAAVHVWLCAEDQEMIGARHRDFFAEHGVQFHEADNIGPHKKWLPLIESGHEGPFVIADDDTFYPSDWFGALVDEGAERPDEIIAHRCHNMKFDAHHHLRPYADWQRGVTGLKESSHYLFAVGCGGTLVRPAAIAEEFRSRELINKLCHRADDIWLKAAYIHSGYKVRKSNYDFPSLDYPGTTQSGLAVTNVDQGENDKQLQQVFQHFDLKLD